MLQNLLIIVVNDLWMRKSKNYDGFQFKLSFYFNFKVFVASKLTSVTQAELPYSALSSRLSLAPMS